MKKVLFAVAAFAILFAVPAHGQLQSQGNVSVTVNVTQQSTIVLSEIGAGLTIDPTTGNSNSITFHSVWNIDATTTSTIKLYASFSSATAALSTSGGQNVSSSQITETASNSSSTVNAGVCNQTLAVGTPGATCPVVLLASTGSNNLSGNNGSNASSYDTTFSISIPNLAAQHFAAGAYSGVLSVQVVSL